MDKKLKATEEQIAYAKILDMGMKLGLIAIVITFIVYLTGILTPYIPVNDLSKYWGLSVHEYLKAANIHPGWAWIGMLGKGDFLNFISIAFLAGVTVICYIAIIPIFFRKKDTVYGVIAILEVLVLVLAASGILKSGGH
ncbi:MAG: hypothetical protein HY752_02420 [Nitrospirae bacterium]|nr:hypothetical protein [Nitrospirota bacterium]